MGKKKVSDKQLLFREIHELISNNNINDAILKIHETDYKDTSFIALKVKAYSQHKDYILTIFDMFDKIPKKKRMYIPVLHGLIRLYPEKAFDFLNKISKMFRLNKEDIKDFYHINNEKLYEIIAKHHIIVDPFEKTYKLENRICSGNELGKIKVDKSNIIKLFKNKYDSSMIHINEWKDMFRYNVFIDGANILYGNKKNISIYSFIRLQCIYNKFIDKYSPIIILHQRHRDYLKKNFPKYHKEIKGILKKMNIYYTPNQINDDLFFIYAGLNVDDSLILTNDKFRDHIFKIPDEDLVGNNLSKWIENSVIRFKGIDLIFPNSVSFVAQKVNDMWYIPTTNGEWICKNSRDLES